MRGVDHLLADQTLANAGELQPDLCHLVVLQAAHHQHRIAEREFVADLRLFVEAFVEQVRCGRGGETRGDGEPVELRQFTQRHVARQGEAAKGFGFGFAGIPGLGEQPVEGGALPVGARKYT